MKISIVALGWLGNALFDYLELKNHSVSGTYHSKPKGKKSEVFFDFTSKVIPIEVINSELVVFNLTPTIIQNIEFFKSFVNSIEQEIIFISSTSVYGQTGTLTEEDVPAPLTNNGKLLHQCEKILLKRGRSTVIRPAGLYGNDRHPGKSIAGKSDIDGGGTPINLTSQKDLINIIEKCINTLPRIVINAVNVNHPNKKTYYQSYCSKNFLKLPNFNEISSKNKIVNTIYKDYKVTSDLP
jgi:nucleoside-diphosphate-sugar epimerase